MNSAVSGAGSVRRDLHRGADARSTTRSAGSRRASPRTHPPASRRRRCCSSGSARTAASATTSARCRQRATAARPPRVPHDDRVGYCEQFAASMAIMARIIGIPARVAVGFLEPERATNGRGSSPRTTCTPGPSSTSPGSGWVRFEPTPQARASRPPDYTEAQFAEVTETPTPSAARPSEDLPERGAEARRRRGHRRQQRLVDPLGPGRRRPARPGAGGLLLLTPRRVRTARRRAPPRRRTSRRPGSSCATSPSTWATPGRGAGRRARPASWLGQRLARPSTTARDPDRPRTRSRAGPRGGSGPGPARLGSRAQPLRPRPRDRHRRPPRRRPRPRRGVARRRGDVARRRAAAEWWPTVRRGTPQVVAPAHPRGPGLDHDPDDESTRTVDEPVG